MEAEKIKNLVREKYKGIVRIADIGTDKFALPNKAYRRKLLLVGACGSEARIDMEFLDSFFCIVKNVDEVWYVKNYKETLDYIDSFANTLIEEILK